MGKRTTFFIIDRKLLEDPLWTLEPFSKGQAWLDLIGRASYEDGQLTKRGQLLASERGLAKRWKWSRKRVQCFLKSLETKGMIQRTNLRTTSSTTNGTTITIENYDKYQSKGTSKGTTKGTKEGAVYNNINNLNNISLMADEETDELLETYSPEALADLEQDVRSYYEANPDKVFPGWVAAIKKFDRNQKRWGTDSKPRTRKRKSNDDLIRELQLEEEQRQNDMGRS